MKRQLCSIVTIVAMCVSIVPGALWANNGNTEPVDPPTNENIIEVGGESVYIPKKAERPQNTDAEVKVLTDQDTVWNDGWYIVKDDALIIEDQIVVQGDVHLILPENTKLICEKTVVLEDDDQNPATPSKNHLTIWQQSEAGSGTFQIDSLDIFNQYTNEIEKFNMYQAILGGRDGKNGGDITINGGNLRAVNARYGAAIGGGNQGCGGTFVMNGGNVYAEFSGYKIALGNLGAGIGGGNQGNAGTIVINDGVITVNGVSSGAGIGGGEYGDGGSITINGGNIDAHSHGGAGIGSGRYAGFGHLTINDGNVKGYSYRAAGIGSGVGHSGLGNMDDYIHINGGNVEAVCDTSSGGAALGGGDGSHAGDIVISGGNVKAMQMRPDGAGIGSSSKETYGDIIISGGTVYATGAPAIGARGIYTNMKFLTTAQGNATIFANGKIKDQTGKDNHTWSGIIFEDNNGKVYTSAENGAQAYSLPQDLTVPKGKILQIDANASLAVPAQKTLTIEQEATVCNDGQLLIEKNGKLVNNGQLTGNGSLIDKNKNENVENPEFIDTKGHWAENEINEVVKKGLFNGVGDQCFAPDEVTNRAMLVTVLHNMEGNPRGHYDGEFMDVPADAWFANGVNWAAENGIVNGVGPNQFGPMMNLNREQMVTMLYRYADNPKIKDYTVLRTFEDQAAISDWAIDATCWAIENGIVTGMDQTHFAPQGQATRAQLAAIMSRFIKL